MLNNAQLSILIATLESSIEYRQGKDGVMWKALFECFYPNLFLSLSVTDTSHNAWKALNLWVDLSGIDILKDVIIIQNLTIRNTLHL